MEVGVGRGRRGAEGSGELNFFSYSCIQAHKAGLRIPGSMSHRASVFLSRETGISGNFVGRIQGAKCPFDLQFLTWDFS